MSVMRRLPVAAGAAPEYAEPPMMAAEPGEAGLSMNQVFAVVWAHRMASLLITTVLLVLAVVAIKLLPKTYVSTATIVVNYEVNDPLGGQEFPVMLMDNYIATQIQLMQTSEVLLPVIEQLKLTENKEFTQGYQGIGTMTDFVKAKLLRSLLIQHRSGTQLIYVSADSKTAAGAAQIANKVAEVYIGQQQRRLNSPAVARAGRYSEQLEDLKNKVNAAQERVTEFRQSTGLTDVTASNNEADISSLNNLEMKYQDALNALRTAEISQANQQDAARASTTSTLIQGLKSQLGTLQGQMAEYQTTYGPRHPKVIELQSQIEATKKTLAAEMSVISNNSNVEVSALRELVGKLKPAVEAQRQKVMNMRRQQDDGAKLLLELDSARAVYKQALDGYDRMAAAAGGQYSNVSIMSAAEVPLKSTKPNKVKLLVLAIGAAFGAGLVLPFLYEFLLRRRVRCRDDLERDLMLPVLAEFEALPANAAGAA